jgi:hypothetical protein
MSTQTDIEIDLEKLFLPAWAKQSPAVNHYANYEGEPERFRDRRDDRRDRPPRRREPFTPRPEGAGVGSGPRGGPRPPRPGFDKGPRRPDRERRPERPMRPAAPPPPPAPDLNVDLIPDATGVEHLSRQIKMTGRAYPLFDIAQMILDKPERHEVVFSVQKRPDGTVVQPMFVCALDDTVWLSENAAVEYVLDRHFATFYQAERTQIEPPKGTYTFVAQCGFSGILLGPPNHHDYQNQLRRLHAERFSRMPFEVYKSRVRIVRDEAVVKKWIDDQSWRTEFVCLNMPEPLRLGSRAEVEKHFREVHLPNIIKPVESHRLTGPASRDLRDQGLKRVLRECWEDQRRFPLQIATVLSQQFAARGLQFFKVNRTVTHVSVSRPHFLDLEVTPVSETVRRIVNFINATPKCFHKQLLDALTPMPEGATEPTPERAAVTADLHWLVHQGHVIEFANGLLETAKRPLPKPPKPTSAPAESVAAAPATGLPEGEPQLQPSAGGTEAPAAMEPAVPVASVPAGEPAAPEAMPAPVPTVEIAAAPAPEAPLTDPSASADQPKVDPPVA